MKPRQFVWAGNWKLNKTPNESAAFVRELIAVLDAQEEGHFVIFPQTLCVEHVCLSAKGSAVHVGVQNIYSEVEGAFTGEVSAQTAKAIGCQFALIGHSERRQIFKENDEFLRQKIKTTHLHGLTPVLCVGETLEERKSDRTKIVLEKQLSMALSDLDVTQKLFIAYEPVWAIGTGIVASATQAQESHLFIREWLVKNKGHKFSESVGIWYGGSVKPDNAAELSSCLDVDGFLIGGASLKLDSFISIFKNSRM